MPNSHSLDVAYNSTITPWDATKPVAMAYGFVLFPAAGGTNRGQGQRAEKVKGGTTFSIDVFDASNTPSTGITGTANFTPRNSSDPATPLMNGTTPVTNPVTLQLSSQGANSGSAGCNIQKAMWWSDSRYTLVTNPSSTSKMFYGCTITVTLNGQTYKIDPELIIEELIPAESEEVD